MTKSKKVLLSISHNIALTMEQREKVADRETIEVIGVSVPVWVALDRQNKQGVTSEPASEVFCKYWITNEKEDTPIQFHKKGYKINVPQLPEDYEEKTLTDEELLKMSSKERGEWHMNNKKPPCGHLWSGSRSADELKRRPVYAKVITWYKNQNKLSSKKSYKAQVLFWSNVRGKDSSLLKFKPDWQPNYFPIATLDYEIIEGMKLHSVGCDGGREVAHYDVEFVNFRGSDLVTRFNSPRPGRSGGGLLSTDGFYVGTCWGTSSYSGNGVGYFTPLASIHKVFSNNGYDWLLNKATIARRIPIRDYKNPNQTFPGDYLPIPGRSYPFPYRVNQVR